MMAEILQSWIDVKDAAPLFGMTHESIKNAISENRFPCPTYKLGKRRVIDRDVLAAYFAEQKTEGMKKLKEGPAALSAKRAHKRR